MQPESDPIPAIAMALLVTLNMLFLALLAMKVVGTLSMIDTRPRMLHIRVEGNIGVGKSTLVHKLAARLEASNQRVQVKLEAVDDWTSIITDCGKNVLHSVYDNPKRYAFEAQVLMQFTQQSQALDASGSAGWIIAERSYRSSKIFQRLQLRRGTLEQYQYDILQRFLPAPTPSDELTVYLRAEPATCKRRMDARGRPEEAQVELDYLTELHTMHDEEFMSSAHLVVDCEGHDACDSWCDQILRTVSERAAMVANKHVD